MEEVHDVSVYLKLFLNAFRRQVTRYIGRNVHVKCS